MESRIYLVVCMLLPLTQLTFSEDTMLWCSLQQEHSMHAVNGQNVSLSFNMADHFGGTQSLVWRKGDHNVCEKLSNHSLECFTRESSEPDGRYSLTRINGTSFDMSIAFTEQNDSGQHIVKIQQGTQTLCTIVILNLTIEGMTPICSTKVNKRSRKLQMSCQWAQVNKGDRAQLLAGNQVVYEYEMPEMNFRRDFYSSNTITAYVAPRDIFNDNIMPSECVITNAKYKLTTSGVCTFPEPINQIRQDLNQGVVFECCKFLHATVISWWYTKGEFLIPINITEWNPLVDDMRIAFLCVEKRGDFKMIVHDIWRVQFKEDQRCSISVSPKGSAVTIACENTFNNSLKMSAEEDNGIACNETETHLLPNANADDIPLYSLAALSSVALTFSLCCCFVKCCKIFFRKTRYRLKEDLDQEASNTRNNENADSVDMTILSIDPQPRRESELTQSAPSQYPSDENNFCANQEASLSEYDLPDRPPTLPSRRHLVKRDKKRCDISTVKQFTSDDICNTNPVGKSIASADASTASNYDSTYCSVDDVQGTLTNTGIKGSASKSFLSSNPTSMTSGDHQGNYDLFNQKESSSPSADPDKRNLVINNHSDHTVNPDSFYAQPDMNRKTKRMTSAESDYDDPRPPGMLSKHFP